MLLDDVRVILIYFILFPGIVYNTLALWGRRSEKLGKIWEGSYEKAFVQKICGKDKVYENERSKVQRSKIRSKIQDFLIEEGAMIVYVRVHFTDFEEI